MGISPYLPAAGRDVLLALLALPLLKFVICGTSNCIGVKKAIEIAEKQPVRFKRVGGTKDVYVMEFKNLRILKDLDTCDPTADRGVDFFAPNRHRIVEAVA